MMKNRSSFALALALIVGALPVFAGVCDLRCASVEGAMRRSSAPEIAPESSTGSGSGMASCPLHAADPSGSEPSPSSSSPCHGQRNGGSGAVFVAASSAPSSIGPGPSPALASPFVKFVRAGAISLRSPQSEDGRMPGLSPLPSILRL